ncbi:MAG: hypothetical protein CFE44_24245, partial [Burkholderiales bacterium PBB4]
AGYLGWVQLPGGLQLLAHPVVLVGSGCMVAVEFFADKVPGLDSLWDMVHTLIRIPAGAALAAGTLGADSASMGLLAALMGGSLAATSHVAKATGRAAINTSPEPFTNIGTSLLEDAAVPLGLWLAVTSPWVFAGLLVVAVVGSICLTRLCWRYVRTLLSRLTRIFSGQPDPGVQPAFQHRKRPLEEPPHV